MKQNNDWTDVMRDALRDAELTPPDGGWERLEHALAPAPRVVPLRRRWLQVAAVAAVVCLFVGGGAYLWRDAGPEQQPDFVADHITADTDGAGGAGAVAPSVTPPGSVAAPSSVAVAGPDHETPAVAAERGRLADVRATLPTEQAARTASLSADRRSDAADASTATPALASAPQGDRVAMKSRTVSDRGSSQKMLSNQRSTWSPPKIEDNVKEDFEAHAMPASGVEISDVRAFDQPAQDDVASSASDDQSSAKRGENAIQSARYPSTYNYYDPEDDIDQPKPNKKRQLSLAAAASGGVTSSRESGAGPDFTRLMSESLIGGGDGAMLALKRDYSDYSYRHHQPLSFGLAVRKEFAHGLSLESGLYYTLLWSDVNMGAGRDEVSQKLHFLGMPLRLNWQFMERGRFSMYVGGGGMFEKCIAARFGGESVDETKVQWSVAGLIGAQVRLGNYIGIYFEPEVSHYFTETSLRTSRTDASAIFTLRLGVRFTF